MGKSAWDPERAAVYAPAPAPRFSLPIVQFSEVIPIDLIPCPGCGHTGMVKDAVDPSGTFLWALCMCGETSKVSG